MVRNLRLKVDQRIHFLKLDFQFAGSKGLVILEVVCLHHDSGSIDYQNPSKIRNFPHYTKSPKSSLECLDFFSLQVTFFPRQNTDRRMMF